MRYFTVAVISSLLPTISYAEVAVKKITLGGFHTCAILSDDSIKCWGNNSSGQLGTGNKYMFGFYKDSMGKSLPAIDLGHDFKPADICAGEKHTCALSTNGIVKCWGSNEQGQLGMPGAKQWGDRTGDMGDLLPQVQLGSQFVATTLSCGEASTCATSADGRLKCWGDNTAGQLGLESSANAIGNTAGSMGDALPYVNLGVGAHVKQVVIGSLHACALLTNGTLKCWGDNTYGQLGVGDTKMRGKAVGSMGDHLPALDIGAMTALQVTTGATHSCVLLSNGTAKCWGTNQNGELGQGDVFSRGGDSETTIAKLNDIQTGATILEIQAYRGRTCIRTNEGYLKCWGSNAAGVLGYEDTRTRGGVAEDMGDHLQTIDLGGLPIKRLVLGSSARHMCANLVNGELKCWGANNFGQLGYESNESKGDKPDTMGEMLPFINLTK